MYYTYMIRCEDNSIYTGIAKDLEKRLNEHFTQNDKCAKYTKSKKALKFEIAWQTEDRTHASKLEYRIKRLNKKSKEELIKNPENLNNFFEKDLECFKYKVKI